MCGSKEWSKGMSEACMAKKVAKHLISLQVKKSSDDSPLPMGWDESSLLYPAQSVRQTVELHEWLTGAGHFSYQLSEVITVLHGHIPQSMFPKNIGPSKCSLKSSYHGSAVNKPI